MASLALLLKLLLLQKLLYVTNIRKIALKFLQKLVNIIRFNYGMFSNFYQKVNSFIKKKDTVFLFVHIYLNLHAKL